MDDVLTALRAERQGLLAPGLAEQIEADLTNGDIAISRRVALAYLERPWHETAEKVIADDALAVSTAHVCDVLKAHLEQYELLLRWLRTAQARMALMVALHDERHAQGRGDDRRLRLVVSHEL